MSPSKFFLLVLLRIFSWTVVGGVIVGLIFGPLEMGLEGKLNGWTAAGLMILGIALSMAAVITLFQYSVGEQKDTRFRRTTCLFLGLY